PHRPSVKSAVMALQRAEKRPPPLWLVREEVTAEAGRARRARRIARAIGVRNRDMARFPFLGAGRNGPAWPVSVGIPQQKMCLLKGNRDRPGSPERTRRMRGAR